MTENSSNFLPFLVYFLMKKKMMMDTYIIEGVINIWFIMDLKYCCRLHDYQDVKEATAVFQTLAMMTDSLKHIAEKIKLEY